MPTYAELRKLLAQDKLSKLIDTLLIATARLDTDLNNQVVAITGRLTRITGQLNTGQISHEEANQERSRISMALLDIINQLEADYPAAGRPAGYQQQRVQQAVAPAPSRPIWPYILLGVVGCMVVLMIIGTMYNNSNGVQNPSFEPNASLKEPTHPNSNTGASITPTQSATNPGTAKFTDEQPAEPVERSTDSRSAGYTASDLLGNWQTSFSEEGNQMVFHIQFNGDGTYFLQAHLNGVFYNSEAGRWQLSGNVLHQFSPNIGNTNNTLTWINRNQFKVIDPNEVITLTYTRIQ